MQISQRSVALFKIGMIRYRHWLSDASNLQEPNMSYRTKQHHLVEFYHATQMAIRALEWSSIQPISDIVNGRQAIRVIRGHAY